MKRDRRTWALGWVFALILHFFVVGGLLLLDPPPVQKAIKKPPVRVALAAKKPGPLPPAVKSPPPIIEKKKEVKLAPPSRLAKKIVEPLKAAKPDQLSATPPAPSLPSPTPPVRKRFSIALEATVSVGNVAVAADQTRSTNLFGTTGASRGIDTNEELPVKSETASETKPLSINQVTTAPQLLEGPPEQALRAYYPNQARLDGLEADVPLKILVSTSGIVESVKILRRAGQGFDEAAEKLVKMMRFRPGAQNGKPAAVWISWTYKFRLDG